MKNGDYNLVKAPKDFQGIKYRGKYCLEHHYQRRRKTPSFSYGDISRVLRSPRRAEGGQYFC